VHDHEDGLRYFETPVRTSFRLIVSQLFCSLGVAEGNRGYGGKIGIVIISGKNETSTMEERTNTRIASWFLQSLMRLIGVFEAIN
jgi:hypothetical protein